MDRVSTINCRPVSGYFIGEKETGEKWPVF